MTIEKSNEAIRNIGRKTPAARPVVKLLSKTAKLVRLVERKTKQASKGQVVTIKCPGLDKISCIA